ncbi:MAG: hypothetical protein A3H52_01975 [Candidatus Zambryskibacteria bacterium RIFCSPLOWO2_02_FULL_39_26]|uniref:Triosephosphate isomerase n=1 Tax=Candidatus Zambryskibacteria bacterium RIFCSPLOWO2_12_FULL_39_23 TaxID=1802776 RepID=A0A1G2UR88_9BACT|nr:MAG: hypothetical protein A2W51_00320 [Candidatus Zambryskibacteria bacterium RIFCSPHIGHO2_02_39_10]OHB00253.1 MAG: hypothetical protein A3E59_01620 [Candidatus Zambryskibacteria bacterium RIFCSPHIGHO2_12_FULL_39_47]OHB10075.1 MAG: hypothetical protein A3H52_01975 [Candidatus Zambryskibacteria bacterium RIFCSPLOWO2_02_FULL_39_26]OHB11905.1 MAG: hypothetical protein A3G99_01035 [Candidatus Zambryskibacteria bacterium RIFCSPLOWO2_12_FULL_39_23]
MKKLVVGNWKMNPQSLEEARDLASSVKRAIARIKKTQVVLCPPFVYLSPLSGKVGGGFFLGAQDANSLALGSYTGEVSYSQLYQFGVRFVILGHSERRNPSTGEGETDELINKKIKSVIFGGMTAIVCVGEAVRDQSGEYFGFIKNQITSALKDVSKKSADRLVIAYEPIWAVGAKESMNPRDLHEMSIFIKKVLKDLYGVFSADVRVLYGGDADRVNADSLVRDGNVSGLLVGRESLRAQDFIEMIKLIEEI